MAKPKNKPSMIFSKTTSDETLFDPKNPGKDELLRRTIQRKVHIKLDDKAFLEEIADRLAKSGVDAKIDDGTEVEAGDGRLILARTQTIDPTIPSGSWTLTDSISASFEPFRRIEDVKPRTIKGPSADTKFSKGDAPTSTKSRKLAKPIKAVESSRSKKLKKLKMADLGSPGVMKGFNQEAAEKRSPLSCLCCRTTDPPKSPPPKALEDAKKLSRRRTKSPDGSAPKPELNAPDMPKMPPGELPTGADLPGGAQLPAGANLRAGVEVPGAPTVDAAGKLPHSSAPKKSDTDATKKSGVKHPGGKTPGASKSPDPLKNAGSPNAKDVPVTLKSLSAQFAKDSKAAKAAAPSCCSFLPCVSPKSKSAAKSKTDKNSKKTGKLAEPEERWLKPSARPSKLSSKKSKREKELKHSKGSKTSKKMNRGSKKVKKSKNGEEPLAGASSAKPSEAQLKGSSGGISKKSSNAASEPAPDSGSDAISKKVSEKMGKAIDDKIDAKISKRSSKQAETVPAPTEETESQKMSKKISAIVTRKVNKVMDEELSKRLSEKLNKRGFPKGKLGGGTKKPAKRVATGLTRKAGRRAEATQPRCLSKSSKPRNKTTAKRTASKKSSRKSRRGIEKSSRGRSKSKHDLHSRRSESRGRAKRNSKPKAAARRGMNLRSNGHRKTSLRGSSPGLQVSNRHPIGTDIRPSRSSTLLSSASRRVSESSIFWTETTALPTGSSGYVSSSAAAVNESGEPCSGSGSRFDGAGARLSGSSPKQASRQGKRSSGSLGVDQVRTPSILRSSPSERNTTRSRVHIDAPETSQKDPREVEDFQRRASAYKARYPRDRIADAPGQLFSSLSEDVRRDGRAQAGPASRAVRGPWAVTWLAILLLLNALTWFQTMRLVNHAQ